MNLLGAETKVGEVTSIELELFSIKIHTDVTVFALYAPFKLKTTDELLDFNPIEQTGRVEKIWQLISDRPVAAMDDGCQFLLKFAKGVEIYCPYTNRNEHINIWGPEEDMFTVLPA